MNFHSDHVVGAHPKVMEALVAANQGSVPSYGNDPVSAALEEDLAVLFGREVRVFMTPTGTAANALSLAALTPRWGTIYAHSEAHVEMDECAAPEFYTGGAKLSLVPGDHGRMDLDQLAARLAAAPRGFVHAAQPAAITLTQATEAGTVYTPDQVRRAGAIAREQGVRLHMDGARFANACVHLGVAPAEITWDAGVDVLSFGSAKNGTLGAEAVVVFDPELAEAMGYLRKRAGLLIPKMRFLSAQFRAYLAGDLWLSLAGHANAMATRLAHGLQSLPGVSLAHPVEANELFVDLAEPAVAALEKAGAGFYRWAEPAPDTVRIRLVTSWATDPAEVDRFLDHASIAAAHGRR